MFTVTSYSGFGATKVGGGVPADSPAFAYDFSLAANFTTSGTTITSASDITGNGHNASAPTAAPTVASGLGPSTSYYGAKFNSRSGGLQSAVGLDLRTNGVTLMAIMQFQGQASLAPPIDSVLADFGGIFRLEMANGTVTSGTNTFGMVIPGPTTSVSMPTTGTEITGLNVVCFAQTPFATTRTGTLRLNGGAESGTGTYTLGDGTLTSAQLNIGNSVNNNSPLWGVVGEIRVFGRQLTANEINVEEGYLAWKWGVQGSLPSSHPYKNAPP